jgi:hypothetical protein
VRVLGWHEAFLRLSGFQVLPVAGMPDEPVVESRSCRIGLRLPAAELGHSRMSGPGSCSGGQPPAGVTEEKVPVCWCEL